MEGTKKQTRHYQIFLTPMRVDRIGRNSKRAEG